MEQIQKSQSVRLLDVLVLGPFMIYVGYKSKLPAPARSIMMLSGIATIIYNYSNYVENQKI